MIPYAVTELAAAVTNARFVQGIALEIVCAIPAAVCRHREASFFLESHKSFHAFYFG
jgi:hypothetical protein